MFYLYLGLYSERLKTQLHIIYTINEYRMNSNLDFSCTLLKTKKRLYQSDTTSSLFNIRLHSTRNRPLKDSQAKSNIYFLICKYFSMFFHLCHYLYSNNVTK